MQFRILEILWHIKKILCPPPPHIHGLELITLNYPEFSVYFIERNSAQPFTKLLSFRNSTNPNSIPSCRQMCLKDVKVTLTIHTLLYAILHTRNCYWLTCLFWSFVLGVRVWGFFWFCFCFLF